MTTGSKSLRIKSACSNAVRWGVGSSPVFDRLLPFPVEQSRLRCRQIILHFILHLATCCCEPRKRLETDYQFVETDSPVCDNFDLTPPRSTYRNHSTNESVRNSVFPGKSVQKLVVGVTVFTISLVQNDDSEGIGLAYPDSAIECQLDAL